MKLDREQARRHLSIFNRERHLFQIYPDNKEKGGDFAGIRFGTFQDRVEELERLNISGAAIAVGIGNFTGPSRQSTEAIRYPVLVADFDKVEQLPIFPIMPTAIVQTSRCGFHAYFALNEPCDAGDFQSLQKSLAKALGSDPKVCDSARVIRLAGSYNLKDPANPFQVTINEFSGARYSLNELDQILERGQDEGTLSSVWIKSPEEWELYSRNIPIESGGRNQTLFDALAKGMSVGVPKNRLLRFTEDYSQASGLGTQEALAVFERLTRKEKSQKTDDKITPAKIASEFLESELTDGRVPIAAYFRENWYIYDLVYKKISDVEMKNRLLRFMQARKHLEPHTKYYRAVLDCLASLLENGSSKVPFWRTESGGCRPSANNLIVLKNGILDVNAAVDSTKGAPPLIPHTPDLFAVSMLPFDCQPEKFPEFFFEFLTSILPDLDVQNLIQEIFGYILVPDSSFQKAFYFYGQGANGKTVLLTVVKCLVGSDNFGTFGLEIFSNQGRFLLGNLEDKLLNIVEDANDIPSEGEGTLKAIIDGREITHDRKFKSAITIQHTARIIIASNHPPQISDRSDGTWRRLIVIPFEVQILDPVKQDKRLTSQEFWKESGELPGILNWALEGLRRLRERGEFSIPAKCQLLHQEFREDRNFASIFLKDNYEYSPGCRNSRRAVYLEFKVESENLGYKPMNERNFGLEVKRVFPSVKPSANAVQLGGGERGRVWVGLAKQDSRPDVDTDTQVIPNRNSGEK